MYSVNQQHYLKDACYVTLDEGSVSIDKIPSVNDMRAPILKILSDKQEHCSPDIIKALEIDFQLSAQQKSELLPSGKQTRFSNRVQGSLFRLREAGLVEKLRAGCYNITEKGVAELRNPPQSPRFMSGIRQETKLEDNKDPSGKTDREIFEDSYQLIKNKLAEEVLEKVKKCPPEFFERLVLELLISIGYGGKVMSAGKITGQSGDGGIDGMIRQDPFGFDIICFQAKRWENSVPSKEIRDFAGALDHQSTNKGVFITTSVFSNDAKEFVRNIKPKKIELIDGEKLADLMIDNGIGVSVDETYQIKKLDSDYFQYDN
jgi:restriction system protein